MTSGKWQVTSDKKTAATHERPTVCKRPSCHLSPVTCHVRAFTLVELLVVISIMGLIAALAVPAIINLGKSNVQASAARQMLDDVGRARQLAISDHTTVYMVFVPTNFWMAFPARTARNTFWWNALTPAQRGVASNLCEKQLTGYTFVSLRSVGDQPGQGRARYLAPWQSLPEGTFIPEWKFQLLPPIPMPNGQMPLPFYFTGNNGAVYPIYGFCTTNNIPFPTEDSATTSRFNLPLFDNVPYIAFNYLGQLTDDGQNMAQYDEYIPLAEGSVVAALDPATKNPNLSGPPSVVETPPGNSTNSMYRLVHIDRLTGRATLEYQHVQ